MSTSIITVENLGKKYQLCHQGRRARYNSLRDNLSETARRVFRNPFASRNGDNDEKQRDREEFWALEDLSFEVQPGEVVGIIGRNGAGKSTLLKILSRITEPTKGRAMLNGRVASLLEVGTGFHPELTGRDNIFLNGAILGMKRAEIQRKFDEIVAFAEVERFLDTPVKHYSSGMYVRLAFAVAAHLEPEILVVDEVLAVGDAEFQKKCLGKMQDVSRGGRTVLFVSHNMAAVTSLTTRAIVLRCGHLVFDGATGEAVQVYVRSSTNAPGEESSRRWGRGNHTSIRGVRLVELEGKPTNQYTPGQPLCIEVEFETDGTSGLSLEVFLADASGFRLGMASLYQFHGETLPSTGGTFFCRLEIEGLWLASGSYSLDVTTSVANVMWDHFVESALDFNVPFSNPTGREYDYRQDLGFGSLALLTSASARFHKVPPLARELGSGGSKFGSEPTTLPTGVAQCGG